MKPKTLILMIVAVTCGLAASYMTSRLLADRQGSDEKIKILVAKKSLSRGDMIKAPEDLFEEKQYTKGEEPKMAIADFKLVKGKQLTRPLRAGDFITTEDFIGDKTTSMDYLLPEGHRAVGIRVNPESIAGGFASLPNSRVDIIHTVRGNNESQSYARILLENVLVLAADSSMRVQEDGRAMPANVVTVALKPEHVLKLDLAKQHGNISLALRRLGETGTANVNQIGGGDKGLPPSASETASEPPAPVVVPVKEPPTPTVKEQPKETTPAVPPVTPVAAPKEPVTTVHVQTIYNGPQSTRTEFRREERPASEPSTPPPAKKDDKSPDDDN